jgi:hypothetical protein
MRMRERSTAEGTGMPVRNGRNESGKEMDEYGAEREGQRHGHAREKGENQVVQVQQGV